MNNIFDWNHISDKLSEDEREKLRFDPLIPDKEATTAKNK